MIKNTPVINSMFHWLQQCTRQQLESTKWPGANCHMQNKVVVKMIAFQCLFSDIWEFKTSSNLFNEKRPTLSLLILFLCESTLIQGTTLGCNHTGSNLKAPKQHHDSRIILKLFTWSGQTI